MQFRIFDTFFSLDINRVRHSYDVLALIPVARTHLQTSEDISLVFSSDVRFVHRAKLEELLYGTKKRNQKVNSIH